MAIKMIFIASFIATAAEVDGALQMKDVTYSIYWKYTINKFKCEKDSIADFYDAFAKLVSKDGDQRVWSYVNDYKNDSTLVYSCGERLLAKYNEMVSKNASVFDTDEKISIRVEYRFLCGCMVMIDSWYHWVDLQGGSIISAIFKAVGGDVVEVIGDKDMNKPLNRIKYP